MVKTKGMRSEIILTRIRDAYGLIDENIEQNERVGLLSFNFDVNLDASH